MSVFLDLTLFIGFFMINTLLGIKKQMTSTYDARGRRVGATVIEISPNFVTQVKTKDGKDGYSAVQLGFNTKKSTKKPQIGHAKAAGVDQKIRWFREVKTDETNIEPGQEIQVGQVFSVGDSVKVTGTSKGRGFAGGMKRHGFHGGPRTHGQSDRERAPGSIGSGTTPGRVLKGKKMAGHMGVETVSLRGLEVVAIDKKNNLLTVKGGVPGFPGALLTLTKLGRIKGYTPPPEEKPDEDEEVESNADSSETADNPVSEETDVAKKEVTENAES